MAEIAFNQVHEQLKKKLNYNKIRKDIRKAQRIETVLRQLKQKQNASQFTGGIKQDIINDIRQEALRLLNPKSRRQNLFNIAHSAGQGKYEGVDDIVEAELAAVIAAIQNKATGVKSVGYKDFVAGRDPVTVWSEEIIREGAPRIEQVLQEETGGIREANVYAKRSGKADVNGFKIKINGELGPEYKELIGLFSGVSFSIKNYSSVHEIDRISLGSTKIDKALQGALNYLGFQGKFFPNEAQIKNESEHLNHLIFAYELAGWGQGTLIDGKFKELKPVDYLVYNDPAVPEAIAVRSTSHLIYKYVFDPNHTGLTKQAISKAFFGMREVEKKRSIKKK